MPSYERQRKNVDQGGTELICAYVSKLLLNRFWLGVLRHTGTLNLALCRDKHFFSYSELKRIMSSIFNMLQLHGMSKEVFGMRCLHTSSRRLAGKTHYERLKLPYDATTAEIKNKFKKLSLKLHPDILKSQGLTDEELSAKSDEYLKVKKSYEVLSDDKKRGEYDLHMGIRRRETSSPNSFFRRPGNTFHFHEQYRYNDVPHFDSKKHQERNERIEKRYVYNQKVNQNIDTFGRDLYARNLGAEGPRKGIYREYKYQPDIRNDESEGKKIAFKLVGGVIGIFVIWYVLCGNYTTVKKTGKQNERETGKERKMDTTTATAATGTAVESGAGEVLDEEDSKKDENINTTSKSGNTMSVNNSYGLMLIGGGSKRDDLEVFEEQTSEAAE